MARSLRDQCVAIIYRGKFTALETWSGYIFAATTTLLPHTRDSSLLLCQVSTALRYRKTERIAKKDRNTDLSRSRHFGLETRLEGIKIAKMANGHCWVPLCNNDKEYDSAHGLLLPLLIKIENRSKELVHPNHVSRKTPLRPPAK